MENERYPKRCYQQLKAHAEMGRTNWASCIRNLLFNLGFGNVWHAQEQINDVKLFLFDVKNRLINIDLQNLNSRINDKSDIYFNYSDVDFYPSSIVAPYMAITHEYSIRRVFTLLRTHSLPIKSNLLRWNIVNNNLCDTCNGTYVENEFHILFRCSKYKTLRDKYIPSFFMSSPNMHTLHRLLAVNDKTVVKNIVTFINEILRDKRHTQL